MLMLLFADRLRWMGKHALIGVLWVYVLSLTVNGRPLFSYAHSLLVKNVAVETLDQTLVDTWERFYRTAKVSIREFTRDDQAM